MTNIATVRDAAEHLAHLVAPFAEFAPIDHEGGIVWGVTVVADPRDPSGQTPLQERVKLADTSPDLAEFIVVMHDAAKPLANLLGDAAWRLTIGDDPQRDEQLAHALTVARAILRGVE